MWVGQQREELNIRLGGKEIMQVDGFVYLREIVTEDGHSEVQVRSRIQARANAWRKIEGAMLEKKSKKLKGKVARVCCTGMPVWSGDSGVDRTITAEAASLLEQLGSSNNKTIEGGQKKEEAMQPNRKIGEKPDEMGMPLGKVGCKQTSKESRGEKTSRTQEKGKATAEMGGLRERGCEKIEGG